VTPSRTETEQVIAEAGMGPWEDLPRAGWDVFSAMRARLRAGLGSAGDAGRDPSDEGERGEAWES
jgi:hypothetical protein